MTKTLPTRRINRPGIVAVTDGLWDESHRINVALAVLIPTVVVAFLGGEFPRFVEGW